MINQDEILGKLILPSTIVSIFAGIVSIYKDSPWYIAISCFILTIFIIVISLKIYKHKDSFQKTWEEEQIEIVDYEGKLALYTDRIRLKALKHNAQDFKIVLHSDGNLSDLSVSEGVISRIEKQMDGVHLTITFSQPISKSQEVNTIITCKIHNSYLNEKEYWHRGIRLISYIYLLKNGINGHF